MHGSSRLFSWFAWLVLAFSYPLKAEKIVLRTMFQDSAPKYLQEANGQISGLGVDLIRAIEKQDPSITFTFDNVMTPLPRIFQELKNDRIDVFLGAIYNDERAKEMVYLKPALYVTHSRLVVRNEDSGLVINSLDDVIALGTEGIILVDRGTAHYNYLKNKPRIRIDAGSDQRHANLQKLLSGRARFYYSSDLGIVYTAQQMQIMDKLTILPYVVKYEPQYLVVSKNTPAEIIARLEKVLLSLSKSGELEKISQPYFTPIVSRPSQNIEETEQVWMLRNH